MLEQPPKIKHEKLIKILASRPSEQLSELVEKINEKYSYWSDVKYQKMPDGVTPEELWYNVKVERLKHRMVVWRKYGIAITVTNAMQRLCHEFDMNFGGVWGAESVIPSENKEQYLISSLMEEAISSSQMEGASTTRKVAKEMLRKSLSPRDKSQRMIFNNYQTIRFIVEHKTESLSSELLKKIHALMTDKTLECPQDCGRYRMNDDVVVENAITHEVVHTPPLCGDIPEFVDELCDFFNEETPKIFIHPIIRGIIVHFMVSYMHPFVDGNGRTARALFYWYMLKSGYWLTEYLSISRVIAKSKTSYENAYLYTEADGLDMGYFIAYHLRVLDLSFRELQVYIKRKVAARQHTSKFLTLGGLNERQAEMLNMISEESDRIFTVKELQNYFSVTHTTVKSDVDELTKRKLLAEIALNKVKKGYMKGEEYDRMLQSISC